MKARLHLFLSIILIFALVFPASALPGKEPCSSGLPHPPAANVDVRRNLTGQGAISKTTPNVHLYLYTGEQFDPDLGFYYLRARYSNPDSGRFWTMDSYEGGGSDPRTLHKYLYCHANPVNGIDPSGNMTVGEAVTVAAAHFSTAGRIVIAVWSVILGGGYGYNHLTGDALTTDEEATIARALQIIDSAGNGRYHSYAERGKELTFNTYAQNTAGTLNFAETPSVALRLVKLRKDTLKWDDSLVAALLIHEIAHTKQKMWFARWTFIWEAEAYQIESDLMNDIGLTGTDVKLWKQFPQTGEFFYTLADFFYNLGIDKPAVQKTQFE